MRSYRRAGPPGETEVVLRDDSNDEYVFSAETFCNHYNTLTLAQYVRPKETRAQIRDY